MLFFRFTLIQYKDVDFPPQLFEAMAEPGRNNDARHRCFCQHNSVLILCDEINKLLLLEEESLHVVAVTVDLEGGFAIRRMKVALPQ
jgi:hypothetical protein